MVDPYAALRTPCRGQKRPSGAEIFATPFWNSFPLSYYLKKVEVRQEKVIDGEYCSQMFAESDCLWEWYPSARK